MITLIAASLTDPGRVRAVNQDRAWSQIFNASDGVPVGLFIVCDGIGGHKAGDHASHWALEAIKRDLANSFIPKDPKATRVLSPGAVQDIVSSERPTRRSVARVAEERVRTAIEKANRVVCEYARQNPLQAGNACTTVTMALVQGNLATIGNVGDSRTYMLRDGRLRQITEDHSVVAKLVDNGEIRPDEIFSHPQRNIIYRSLGQKRELKVDIFQDRLLPSDQLLLCSDGLWEMVQDDNVLARLIDSTVGPYKACRNLVAAANAAGGEDNIGVVVAKVT